MANVTFKVSNIKIGIQAGTARTLYASWDAPEGELTDNNKKKHTAASVTKEYSYQWLCYHDDHSFVTDGTTKYRTLEFTPGDNVTAVDLKVKPVAEEYEFTQEKTTGEGKKKKTTKEKKKTTYYSGQWASYTEKKEKKFVFAKHKASVYQVDKVYKVHLPGKPKEWIEKRSGRKFIKFYWDDARDKTYYEGFELTYGYYDGATWNDETSSVSMTSIAQYKVSGKENSFFKEFEVPATAKQLRFTARPVPKTEGVFIGENKEYVTHNVTIKPRSTTTPTIELIPETNGSLVAKWQIKNESGVDKFSTQWQTWVQIGSNPYDGYWSSPTTGEVSFEEKNSGILYGTDFWLSEFDIPEGSDEVMFSVKPEPKVEGDFEGQWESETYSINLKDKTVKKVKIERKPNTDWTVIATWGVSLVENVEKFEYMWRYQIKGSKWFYTGATGDVSTEGYDNKWLCEFDPPSDVKMVQIRVRPMPKYSTAFAPEWSDWVSYSYNIPTLQVKNVVVTRVGNTGRNLLCTWDALPNDERIESYQVDWAYKAYGKWFYDQSDTTHGNINKYNHSDVYTAPAEAEAAKAIVRPNPVNESAFTGIWSEGSQGENPNSIIYFTSKPTKVANLKNTRAKDGRVLFTWEIINENFLIDYTIETSYYSEDGVWTGITETQVNKLTPNYYFDVPAGALTVRARVKPNYETDCGLVGEYGNYSSRDIVTPSKTVTGVEVLLQKGSTRDVIATWSNTDRENVGSYSTQWRYGIPNPNPARVGYIWVSDSTGSAPVDTPSTTYTAPDNAVIVGFRVMPVPEEGKEFAFNGAWSVERTLDIPDDTTPQVPAVPTPEVEGSKVTVYVDTYDENSSSIEFQINDTKNIIKTATAQVILNRASIDFPLAKGMTYRARARGVNNGGQTSEWSEWSSDITTGPSVPTNVKCSATSKTSVAVSWTGVISATSYTVERTQKKKYFDTAPSQVSSDTLERSSTGTLTLEMLGLETESEWFFRVKATNSQGDSEWSAIVNTIIGSKPAAPTTWSSTTTAMNTRDIYLYWLHNSEDKSREVAAQLELTVNGVKTTYTIQNESEEENHVGQYRISANTYNTGAKIQWRVRTKGITNEWGDWSTERIVDIYAAPVLTMYLTDGTNSNLNSAYLTTLPLRVNLTATPASQHPIVYSISITSNATYESNTDTGAVRIISKGEEVFSKHYYTTLSQPRFELSANELDLDNNIRYTLTAKVSMDSGLTAETSSSFTVNWGEINYLLNARLTYSSEAVSMSIAPYCTDLTGAAASDITISIYRRDFDGAFTEIATGLPSNGYRSAIDPHPAMDVARYRLVGKSRSTGQIIYYDLPGYEIGEPGMILQWDEAWSDFDSINAIGDGWDADPPWNGSLLKLPYNVDTTHSADPDSEMVNYIGRKHPVSYYGTQVGETFSWKTDVPKEDKDTIYALRRLAVYTGDVYVRESSGVGCWAHVKVSFNINHCEVIVPVNLDITRVEGGA